MPTRLDISGPDPSPDELAALSRKCELVIGKLKSEKSEARLPVFVEFSGTPKSGKSSIIGIVGHFLKRHNVRIAQPVEGASLRTPEPLKDDWLAFNAWSGCYALQNILVDCFMEPPVDVVIWDRGLFDIAGWMRFLSHERVARISSDDRQKVTDFFALDLWRRRVNAVFLFTADYATAMVRENHCKLTNKGGSVMNETSLSDLKRAFDEVGADSSDRFENVFSIDTSYQNRVSPSFLKIAYRITERILDILHEMASQELLIIRSGNEAGFVAEPRAVGEIVRRVLNDGQPQFMEREAAENSQQVRQIVPYALLKNAEGKYLLLRRRADTSHKELRRKHTLLVGGHAEKRDWDAANPASVFENCLRRELEEELVGIQIKEIRPIGFISDLTNSMGVHHLAYIHEVNVGGKPGVRRQAIDKEFGREPVEWVESSLLSKGTIDFDPWSKIVVEKLFDAPPTSLFSV